MYQAEQRHRLHTTLTAAVKSDESLRGKSLRLTVPGNSPASISARFSNIFDQHLLVGPYTLFSHLNINIDEVWLH